MSNIYDDKNGKLDSKKIAAIIANEIFSSQIYNTDDIARNILDDVESAICEIRSRGGEKSVDNIADIVKRFRRDRFLEIIQGAYEEAGFGPRYAEYRANCEDNRGYIDECAEDGSTYNDVVDYAMESIKDEHQKRVEEVRKLVLDAYGDCAIPRGDALDIAYNTIDKYTADVIARDLNDDRIVDDLDACIREDVSEYYTNAICEIERKPEFAIIKQACEEHEAQVPDEYVDQETDDIACGGCSNLTWTTRAVITGWVKAGTPQSWIDTLAAINAGK